VWSAFCLVRVGMNVFIVEIVHIIVKDIDYKDLNSIITW
jgi:hypothetical protein